MNCFYHPTTAAIGTCKSCCKGLCPECAADLGKGLACKGRCEEDVKALNELLERGIKRASINEHIYTTARGNRYLGAFVYIVFGTVFIGFASYRYLDFGFETPDLLLWGMGGCFLIFGMIALQRAIRFPQPQK